MLRKLLEKLPKPLKVLAIRFDKSPIDTVDKLTEFVRTRSSYVAQTSLFGYLKARMGTRFPQFFEDEVFSRSIRLASAKLFISCLGDMTIFAVAYATKDGVLREDERSLLADYCFGLGMKRTLDDLDPAALLGSMESDFTARARATDWIAALDPMAPFAGSERDIIRFAPVIDEFKHHDQEIVGNSIRYRWRDVREQFRSRVDGAGIAEDWRAGHARSDSQVRPDAQVPPRRDVGSDRSRDGS